MTSKAGRRSVRDSNGRRTAPPATFVIAERVVAAVAARAAVTVAGVVRVEPGLLGLAGSLTRSVRQRITGLTPAPTEGVRVRVEPADASDDVSGGVGRAWVEIDIATSGQDQIAAVGQAVQRTVTRVVAAATGYTVTEVAVSILDVHLGPAGGR